MAPESNKEFVHLHVHSHNSLLDGMSTQEEIAAITAQQNSRAFALTDHGYVAGAVAAYNAAKKHDVKFIPGEEIYLCNDNTAKPTKWNKTTHLLLLAQSQEGLRNLYKLSSEGATTGAYGATARRITNEHLERHASGLIATTGCLSSRVSHHLKDGNYDLALEDAATHRDIFGRDNYFVEVQNHGIDDQLAIIDDQLRLAKDLGVGLVATNDTHYTSREDVAAHDHLLALQTGATTLQDNRFKFDSDQHYLKTAEEMYELFPEKDFPDAITNTLRIADMVEDIKLDDNGLLIPEFEYEEYGYDSADAMLIDTTKSGLAELLDGDVPEHYIERLEHELDVIRTMGIQSYFLIVAAIMKFCRDEGIWSGPGRGSAAGSLVSYSLQITKVDPIEHGLLFSRFLNAGRTGSMPDIDVDIEPARRHEVVEYMARRWGDDRVVNISTLQTFKAKSALESVGRAHDCFTDDGIRNFNAEGKRAKSLVDSSDDLLVLMQDQEPDDPDERAQWQRGEKLREFIAEDEEHREVIEISGKIAGRNRGHGVHPAGILITPGPVRDIFPVRKGPKDSGLDVCQFNCNEVDQLNGLKMDLLGLSNLTVLELAVMKIERDLGEKIDLDNIPLDDRNVYDMLSRGESTGVFQIESPGMQELMKRMQPTSFADISALIALYRPGPKDVDSHNIYARRKNDLEEVSYFHDDAQEILGDTYGLIVYQEQVMAIAQKFASFTEKEADDFRRAMGKKSAQAMEEQHAKFVDQVEANGYPRELGVEIWDKVEPFAGYAFNKSHSVSYGFITYQTAWLKANYYPQFVAAYIDVFPNKSSAMSSEAISKGYGIYAPDVNKSFLDAKSTEDSIHVGFNRVASFRDVLADSIVEERERAGAYTSLLDFVSRNPKIAKNALINLIKAGAFENIAEHTSRELMVEAVEEVIHEGRSLAASKKKSSQFSADFLSFGGNDTIDTDALLTDVTFDFASETTSKRNARIMERDALGFFVGEHPFSDYEDKISGLRRKVPAMKYAVSSYEAINDHIVGRGQFFGVLVEFEERVSKAGREMTSFSIDCGDMSILSGMVMGHGHVSEDDLLSLVLIDGEVEEDTFSARNSEVDDSATDDDDEIGAGAGEKKQEVFDLRFRFGARITPVLADVDEDISHEAMAVESKRMAGSRKNKQTMAEKRADRSTVLSSRRDKRESPDDGHERRQRAQRSAETTQQLQQQMIQRQRAKRASQSQNQPREGFAISYTCESMKCCGRILQHVAFYLTKRCNEEGSGRPAVLYVNGERCETYMNVENAQMTLLRSDLQKITDLTGVEFEITDEPMAKAG